MMVIAEMEPEYGFIRRSRHMVLIHRLRYLTRSELLFLLPLAMESLTMLEQESVVVPPSVSRIIRAYEKMRPEFEAYETKYVIPVMSQNTQNVQRYIEETSDKFIEYLGDLTLKIVSNEGPQILTDVMAVMGSDMMSSRMRDKSFPDKVTDSLREAVELEYENTAFLVGRYGQLMFSPDFPAIAESAGLDFDEFIKVSGNLYLSMSVLAYGIWTKDKRYTPLMSEIARLCLRYAEERDSLITTIGIALDPEKRKSIEDSYREYEKLVNSSA